MLPGFAYEKGEKEDYIARDQIKERIYDIQEGDYIETWDNWIIPCIYANSVYIRFLNRRGLHIKYLRDRIYSYNYKIYYNERPRNKNTKETTSKQKEFAWELGKTLDLKTACNNTGYSISYGYTLLNNEIIQREVALSFKTQMSISDAEEKDLVIGKYEKMMATLQEGVEKNIKANPEGAAKLAEVMSKSLRDMGLMMKESSSQMKLTERSAVLSLPMTHEAPIQMEKTKEA